MAFNLYFAGQSAGKVGLSQQDHLASNKACKLISYGNEKEYIKDWLSHNPRGKLLVDSGAFSVAHNDLTVDIDEYISYINEHPEIEYFIELDKIPYPVLNHQTAKESAEVSWENYLYMLDRVNDPYKILPVWHLGEHIDYLKRILNFKYKDKYIPYICIGGRYGISTPVLEKYFHTIFGEIKKSNNPNVKVHILGMTSLSTLEKFPFYSADSTSWLLGAVNGSITTSLGSINVSKGNTKKNNYNYLSNKEKEIVKTEVNKFGYDVDELSSDYKKRILFNIDYCLDWAKNYKCKYNKIYKIKKFI